MLVFSLKNCLEKHSLIVMQVEGHSIVILSCADILVSGTGEKRIRMPPVSRLGPVCGLHIEARYGHD